VSEEHTPVWPFYRGAKGSRTAKEGGLVAQNLNCPTPPNSKARGEDLKIKWKEEKKERGENVAGWPICLVSSTTGHLTTSI
jgi:hypothetical protein